MAANKYVDEDNLTYVLEKINTNHISLEVNSQSGAHGIRFYNDTLQVYETEADRWVPLKKLELDDVSGILVNKSTSKVFLNWSDPTNLVINGSTILTWAGTKVVRKSGSAPEDVDDGTLVLNNTVRNAYANVYFEDSDIDRDSIYYYRFFPYATDGKVTNGTSVSVSLFPFGPVVTPINDVQTWLACAGIDDKSYTTLTEVLADTTTLLALISDENACDYLVRSAEWATDLCADSTAMTYIGANDYCADLLCLDSTWLTALISSPYSENVVNASVPTMTSDTTPSGVASCYKLNGSGGSAYLLFDKSDSTSVDQFYGRAGSIAAQWIQYQFTAPVKIYKTTFSYYVQNGSYLRSFKIQASNDGSTWVDIQTFTTSSNESTLSFDITEPYTTKYSYWRWQGISVAGSYALVVKEMNFYGRS